MPKPRTTGDDESFPASFIFPLVSSSRLNPPPVIPLLEIKYIKGELIPEISLIASSLLSGVIKFTRGISTGGLKPLKKSLSQNGMSGIIRPLIL